MKEMNTATYAEKKTFFPFGENQIVAFLNEEVVENWKQPNAPDDAEPITGYSYTGPREDGGMLLPCEDPSDYGCLVNAIIRSEYSLSDELAIRRHNGWDPEAYQDEWVDYNQFCEEAKALAKKWLGI